MQTDSVTAKDRHVIISSPLVDTKCENIWGVFGKLILGSYTILWLMSHVKIKHSWGFGVRYFHEIQCEKPRISTTGCYTKNLAWLVDKRSKQD